MTILVQSQMVVPKCVQACVGAPVVVSVPVSVCPCVCQGWSDRTACFCVLVVDTAAPPALVCVCGLGYSASCCQLLATGCIVAFGGNQEPKEDMLGVDPRVAVLVLTCWWISLGPQSPGGGVSARCVGPLLEGCRAGAVAPGNPGLGHPVLLAIARAP